MRNGVCPEAGRKWPRRGPPLGPPPLQRTGKVGSIGAEVGKASRAVQSCTVREITLRPRVSVQNQSNFHLGASAEERQVSAGRMGPVPGHAPKWAWSAPCPASLQVWWLAGGQRTRPSLPFLLSTSSLQLLCRCTLSRLSSVPAEGVPPTPLPPELLTALRILSREHSGLEDLLSVSGVGVVLQKAGLRGGGPQSGFRDKDKLEIDSACGERVCASGCGERVCASGCASGCVLVGVLVDVVRGCVLVGVGCCWGWGGVGCWWVWSGVMLSVVIAGGPPSKVLGGLTATLTNQLLAHFRPTFHSPSPPSLLLSPLQLSLRRSSACSTLSSTTDTLQPCAGEGLGLLVEGRGCL